MIEAGLYRWAARPLDRYNRFLLSRSFARIRVAGLDLLEPSLPVIAAPNHSCWWDGCVDLFLSRSVARTKSFLMMGEEELGRHKVFSSLGVFGVAADGSAHERARSVRYTLSLLRAPEPRIVWIYPQGEMLPARVSIEARDGVAVLAASAGVSVLPVAHRYEFIADDHPEVIVRIGSPLRLDADRTEGTRQLSEAIAAELAQIDRDLLDRRFDGYETVLNGPVSRNERLRRAHA